MHFQIKGDTMDPITGSTAFNTTYMTGNNNINTSNDVMANRNTAAETSVAQNNAANSPANQDVMAAQANQDTTAASVAASNNSNPDVSNANTSGADSFPQDGNRINMAV